MRALGGFADGALHPDGSQGRRGRPCARLKRMLRTYFPQHWIGPTDEGLEYAIGDSYVLLAFPGIDLRC